MVFIYDRTTGQIKFFYSGNISQLTSIQEAYPDEATNLGEAIFPDAPAVLERPHDYRVVLISNRAITYAKKPTMKLYFKDEDEKETDEFFIAGDGINEVSLHVQIDGLNPLDEFGCIYDKDNLCNLQLYINDELVDVEAEQSMDPTTANFIVSITSNEPGLVLNIRGNDNLFLTNSVTLEVV